jgi:transketolase
MTNNEKCALKKAACKVRMGVIESTHGAKSGHPGGSLSAADVFAYLYTKELRVDPQNPQKADRDRFVLSKGHTAPGLYSALALRGFFPWEELKNLRHIGSFLQGHPNMNMTPGIDMSTGSLGQGVSTAVGMALGAKKSGLDSNVYTLLGDGEIAEGQVWEAFMFAAHYKLDKLCVIIDLNGLQIDGATSDVMNTAPVDEKMAAFGFDVTEINGNDFEELEKAFNKFHENIGSGKPTAILMHTVKGKGVSFMEDQVGWHGKAPNDDEYNKAMDELNAQLSELNKEGE